MRLPLPAAKGYSWNLGRRDLKGAPFVCPRGGWGCSEELLQGHEKRDRVPGSEERKSQVATTSARTTERGRGWSLPAYCPPGSDRRLFWIPAGVTVLWDFDITLEAVMSHCRSPAPLTSLSQGPPAASAAVCHGVGCGNRSTAGLAYPRWGGWRFT